MGMGRKEVQVMGCRHKKERGPLGITLLWCTPCAEKHAGPPPEPKWKHGEIAKHKSWNEDGGPYKVLDSEIQLIGTATEDPKWSEYLVFRDGGGSASLFVKLVRK